MRIVAGSTKTPSRRHFESKRTSKTGSTSKIGSRNGFVRFGIFCIFRSLSPHGVLNSGHKLTVTYYGEITIEPFLNPEFDVDHDFEVKNGCFQSLFPRFRVISANSTGRASHSDHFSGTSCEHSVRCCDGERGRFSKIRARPPVRLGETHTAATRHLRDVQTRAHKLVYQ